MVCLTSYHCGLQEPMTFRIAAFDVRHAGLVGRHPNSGALRRAAEPLEEWVRDSILLVIERDGRDVGFLRMSRFPIVVKIEALFVDEAQRGQGSATRALELTASTPIPCRA